MSHTVTARFTCNVTSAATQRAIALCGAKALGPGEFQLYGTTRAGYGIQLPGWRYPVVAAPPLGGVSQLFYDNYDGRWGDVRKLHALENEIVIQETLDRAATVGGVLVDRQVTADGVTYVDYLFPDDAEGGVDAVLQTV